jgi:hypothetical protein
MEGNNGIWPAISQFLKRAGFFYMPQCWDMGQIILLPFRRKACCGFFQPEKSNGFGRERTRDLGYTVPVPVTPVFLKMNLRVRNMYM